ncbi:MAG TPA: acryloyl-CoA reductase [Ramlibacter sp.]|nr:acryloyl-CoA reductase [Ramlibacter sp.]
MAETFKAFRVHTVDGKPQCRFEQLTIDQIDPGPVVIRTAFSAITYKDAMAARGVGRNVRTERPCVTGVDMSGTVVSSEDSRFKPGDEVIVTNYQLGTEHDGAYADFARVPAEWVVPMPAGLTLYEAMGLGTSGLTAALAVDRLEKAGLKPEDGPVAVSGASGGVGSLAVDILARRGFEVVAISGKPDQDEFLKAIGATRVVRRQEFMGATAALVSNPPFAGALDNVGGQMLERLGANLRPYGKVAVAGMVEAEVRMSMLPLVLRSIDILGINVSRQLKMPDRRRLWERLGSDLKPRHLDRIARPIGFDALDKTMDSFFNVSTVGRVVVEVGDTAPRGHTGRSG